MKPNKANKTCTGATSMGWLPPVAAFVLLLSIFASGTLTQYVQPATAHNNHFQPPNSSIVRSHKVRQATSSGNDLPNSSASQQQNQLVRQQDHSQGAPPQAITPPAIPSSYVKLGNNTSSMRASSFSSSQHGHHSRFNQTLYSDLQTKSDDLKRGFFEKICIGTSNRLSGQSNKTEHYHNLVERYRNCTYVIGNLELTWLPNEVANKPADMTFLESIREITGYLLIAYSDVEKVKMPNLQIIRGREIFKLNGQGKEEFAMFVIQNKLRALELPNLREILVGDVGFYNNTDLCHVDKIEWEEILNLGYSPRYVKDAIFEDPKCAPCHNDCIGACWGPGPKMCQKYSKTICSPQCEKGRCFGPAPRECCHLFCAGGCTGPKQTDCLACKHFNNDGECIQECPSMRKYNPNKFIWETDPNGKYAFGATCVKECPEHLLRDNGACVRSCPPDKRSQDGECIQCKGPCPKNCQGVDTVNSVNIEQLVNCTEIEGSITILDSSFTGYTDILPNNTLGAKFEPMHPNRLKILSTVRKITGHLNIQAAHPDFRDLNFLNKLETIGGRQLTDMFHSLSIIKTSLKSLNLRSLKKVSAGRITIEENRDLCFTEVNQFARLGIDRDDITIRNNAPERNCREMNLKCHEQCGQGGCWGYGQDECITCNNHKLDDYCVSDCPSTRSLGIFSFESGSRICTKCHPECHLGCNGTSTTNCFQCKNFKDGPYCVAECPNHKYSDRTICKECHRKCVDGCTGPSSGLGRGGCNSCGKFLIEATSPFLVAKCLELEAPCPEGYYQEYGAPVGDHHPLKPLERKPVCRRCHTRCKSCTGYGTHKDVCECAGYLANDQCEDVCPRDFYADDKTRRCLNCSRECNGCFGPSEADCLQCRKYRIYHDSSPIAAARVTDSPNTDNVTPLARRFNCTDQCPQDKPHRITDSNLLDPFCSEDPGPEIDNPRVVSFFPTYFFFILIFSGAIIACVSFYKCQIEKDRTVKLTMRLSGFDDVEPLNQSNVKPNLGSLRSIKETELRRGGELGRGYGGIVYKGAWIPEDFGGKKTIPVAIKVLKDDNTSNKNKEFLDEAFIMASASHRNLVRLLAVCTTPKQLMLITELMPLGCLLHYVRDNKNEICSKNLLEWGKQIARGMEYLEEHRMVHRDLALRNVLLKNSKRICISDFGLAKLLEVDQSEYQSGGGRLPIKWLAPECIRERKFTHKSDVWAFGVTIWELLTFGRAPFEEYEDPKDVPMAIEKGARLEQPSHMSAEVYKVMFACWFYNPEDRPDFKSLVENFVNFARDPERFLPRGINGFYEMMIRGSESENEDYDSNFDDFQREKNLQDAPSQMNNRSINELLGLRHHPSESDTPSGQVLTPNSKATIFFPNGTSQQQMPEDAFSKSSDSQQMSSKSSNMNITDSNNNFKIGNRSNADSCWTPRHTVSTISIGQRSEQPTDLDDYLQPSPCSNEDRFTKFLANHAMQTSRLPPPPRSPRDPPHSAGLIGINNQEYFMTRLNYVNSAGLYGRTNASSDQIPHSLV